MHGIGVLKLVDQCRLVVGAQGFCQRIPLTGFQGALQSRQEVFIGLHMAIFLACLQFVIGVVKQGALQMLIAKIEQGKQCRV